MRMTLSIARHSEACDAAAIGCALVAVRGSQTRVARAYCCSLEDLSTTATHSIAYAVS